MHDSKVYQGSKLEYAQTTFPDINFCHCYDLDGSNDFDTIFCQACEVFNGNDDNSINQPCYIPDETEDETQRIIYTLVDFVEDCASCRACGDW